MPKYEITSPDGKRFEVTAPDGATQEQVLEYAQKNFGAAPAAKAPEPLTEGESIASSVPARFLAGVASPATVLMKMVGPDSIKEQIAKIDALRQRGMEKRDTGFDFAGLAGSMVPGAGIAAGVGKALPAATTLLGKMGQGALTGGLTAAAQPLPGQDELSMEKLKQVGTGAAVGGVIPAVVQGVKSFLGTNRLNPTQQATLREGQAAGYTIPPSNVNPSGLNNIVESIAGKASVGQEQAARNQKITNALTAKQLGLPKDQPVTPTILATVRKEAGQAYDDLNNLRPTKDMEWFPRYHDTDLVDQLKKARLNHQDAWDSFWRTKDSAFRDKAEQYAAQADSIQGDLTALAKANNKEHLVKALETARVKIAKAHDIEKALGEADSNVSAPILGKVFDRKGSKAVTGELATIGKMAEAFPSVMREGAKVPTAGVDGTNAFSSAILGGLGMGTAGPAGIAAAALPWVARPAARNLVLSPTYQKYLAEGIPARYIPIIDAMTQQATGAAGTTVGRNY